MSKENKQLFSINTVKNLKQLFKRKLIIENKNSDTNLKIIQKFNNVRGIFKDNYHKLDYKTVLTKNSFDYIQLIGKGSFGQVRLVRLKTDKKRLYALKIFKKNIDQYKQTQNFYYETHLQQKLCSQFIIQMIKYFEDKKYNYILFEYGCGGDLFQRLRREGRFSKDVSLFYATEIILALKYLHDRDILYRDLKPENVLITSDGHIKIIDFGFSKKLRQGKTFTLCGTPEYLAPEVLNDQGHGKEADIWAFGIFIYELLCGLTPFLNNDPLITYAQIQSGKIEFPSFLESCSKHLIIKLLNPDDKKRLGCNNEIQQIQKHSWFKNVNWNLVLNKKLPSPWCPYLKSSIDTQWHQKFQNLNDSFEQHLKS